jgi:RecA/RadA recombinase
LEHAPLKKMSSGIAPIDSLLGGGLGKGEMLLLFGERGTGKTSFAFQAVIRAASLGIGSTIIYTNGLMPVARLMELAGSDWPKVSNMVWILEVKNFEDQDVLVDSLEEKLPPNTGLLVIDSVTACYRGALGEVGENIPLNKALNRELAIVKDLCLRKGLMTVLTSEVTSQMDGKGNRPVAAAILTYWADRVLRLDRIQGEVRKVTSVKPAALKEALLRLSAGGLEGFKEERQ